MRTCSRRDGPIRGLVSFLLGALLGFCPVEPLPDCTPDPSDPDVGIYRGSGQPQRVDDFEQWLGCRVEYVVDFPARETWEQIAYPDYLLDIWADDPRRLVLSLAMLPTDEPATMEAGVAGEHDDAFASFGRALVADGREDALLRIGWEFNLLSSRWYVDDPALFRAYYRHIVEVLREVPGQSFEFIWNPGRSGVDAVPYYPGDDVVDYIGLDVYDAIASPGTYPYPADCDDACRGERQQRAWLEMYEGDTGLASYAAFARERGRPLVLPEWGLWERFDDTGGELNTYFLRQMHRFITDPANGVVFHAYFENNNDLGRHRLMTSFPEAGHVYRDLFGVGDREGTSGVDPRDQG